MVLTTVLSMMRYVSEIEDRDFVDRLHSYFTTNLLIGLSVLVSFKQFGGKPLECLTPDIFSGSWEEYTENYCWAQDTYFVSPRAIVDGMEPAMRHQRRISYYQWVPFFLLLEAVCFRLPSIMWKYMSGHSGIKISEIIKLSSDPNNIKPEIRRENIKSLTTHLQGALRFHRRVNRKQIRPHSVFCLLNLPYSARYVTSMYILTKMCYLLNVFFQLVLMNGFLETHRYSLYGFGALLDLLNGTTWEQSGMFPRVTLCDFEVRVMGNIQQYTIQCVLVINIFNEKIFVFLWFWYMCVLILTIGSFLFWFAVSMLPFLNRRFIVRHLEMGELSFDADANEKMIDRFVYSYLRADGVFVIRMLTLHSGVIFGTDLVLALWQSHHGVEFRKLKRGNSFSRVDDLARAIESDDDVDAEAGGFATEKADLRRRHREISSAMRDLGAVTEAASKRPPRHKTQEMVNEKLVAPPPPPDALIRAVVTPPESRSLTPTPPDALAAPTTKRYDASTTARQNAENERLLKKSAQRGPGQMSARPVEQRNHLAAIDQHVGGGANGIAFDATQQRRDQSAEIGSAPPLYAESDPIPKHQQQQDQQPPQIVGKPSEERRDETPVAPLPLHKGSTPLDQIQSKSEPDKLLVGGGGGGDAANEFAVDVETSSVISAPPAHEPIVDFALSDSDQD